MKLRTSSGRLPIALAALLLCAGAAAQEGQVMRGRTERVMMSEADKAAFDEAQRLNRSGLDKLHAGDADGAIADFTRGIKISPRQMKGMIAGFYTNRSNAYKKKGDTEAALADLARAVKIETRSPFALLNLADMRRGAGDLDGAVAAYDKAISLKDDFATAYLNRGLILLEQGKEAEAQRNFDKYLELMPGGKESLEQKIGEAKARRGKP